MKLEKLKSGKFKESVLKRNQLFKLNGGGIETGAGHISDWATGQCISYDYGYDSTRDGSYGGYPGPGVYTSFHNRTNVTSC